MYNKKMDEERNNQVRILPSIPGPQGEVTHHLPPWRNWQRTSLVMKMLRVRVSSAAGIIRQTFTW